MTNDHIEEMARTWARYELAAREAEEESRTIAETALRVSGGVNTSLTGVEGDIDRSPIPREAANSILEELTPLFAEEARIKRWNEMRPGKEPRVI